MSRARTSDFKIFSLALSQLSYHGVFPPYGHPCYKICDGDGRSRPRLGHCAGSEGEASSISTGMVSKYPFMFHKANTHMEPA